MRREGPGKGRSGEPSPEGPAGDPRLQDEQPVPRDTLTATCYLATPGATGQEGQEHIVLLGGGGVLLGAGHDRGGGEGCREHRCIPAPTLLKLLLCCPNTEDLQSFPCGWHPTSKCCQAFSIANVLANL